MKKLMKIASIALPIVGAVIGLITESVNQQQRKQEMIDEINAEVERRFTEQFGSIMNEDEELN